jgi:hypothetical protein
MRWPEQRPNITISGLWANFGEVWYDMHAVFTGFSFRSVSRQIQRAMKRWPCALPESNHVQLEAWQIDASAMQIILFVTSTPLLVHGPVCRVPTRRIHSRYLRTVAALPWGPWHVGLHWRVRKFFCANGRCPAAFVPSGYSRASLPGRGGPSGSCTGWCRSR